MHLLCLLLLEKMAFRGKGFKNRVTILPESVIPELKRHLIRVKSLHNDFLKREHGEVELPYALSKKYPNAKYEW
ncbi:hypothetical protein LCGC14_1955970 [marine sediment metagenome]|uniref:Uncharacterized protein n=1 Tax=marine sediment metagenome TaxID=412755 RepID=A0A0F9FG24_9ZZZZ